MMDEKARRRRLRWASLALFGGAPLMVAAVTILNLNRVSEMDALALEQGELLGQLERRVSRDVFADKGDTSRIYLAAPSSTLAKAEIQQLVARLIDEASGRLIEAQAIDDPVPAATGRVHLRATFDTTNERLFDLLYAVETGLPLLALEQITIRKLPGRDRDDAPNPGLRVSFTVRGEWRGRSG